MLLFVDVETTGLSASEGRIVQIAWILTNRNGIVQKRSDYIIRPDDFYIPHSAAIIHGITNEKAKLEGVALAFALGKFCEDAKNAKILIGHNISFDASFIMSDLKRSNINLDLVKMPKLCTMRSSTNFCKIPKFNGKSGYKWPTLSELHLHLFNENFDGAHNAASDIHATMKCFFRLVELREIVLPLDTEENKTKKNTSKLTPDEPKSWSAYTTSRPSQAPPRVLACPKCAATNLIPPDKSSDQAKCGTCGGRLVNKNRHSAKPVSNSQEASESPIQKVPKFSRIFACPKCATKNRMQADRGLIGARCGRCGSQLDRQAHLDSNCQEKEHILNEIERLLQRFDLYGFDVEKVGSKWRVSGKIYNENDLHNFEKNYLDFIERTKSGYYFESSKRKSAFPAHSISQEPLNYESIVARLIEHGFEVERFASNWRVDGQIYFPHELYQFESKCTPERLDAVKIAPQIAELLLNNGFNVRRNRSDWIVDGALLSPEQMVKLEKQCSPQRAAAVKKAADAARKLAGYAFIVDRRESSWIVDGKLMPPEQLVSIAEEFEKQRKEAAEQAPIAAKKLEELGFKVEPVSSNWRIDGALCFPHEVVAMVKQWTPERIAINKKSSEIARKLEKYGFTVQRNGSNWFVDGINLSSEQVIAMEAQCTTKRIEAVNKAKIIANNLKRYGVEAKSEGSKWRILSKLLTPEEVLMLDPDYIADNLRDDDFEVQRIGKNWRVDGEIITTNALLKYSKLFDK